MSDVAQVSAFPCTNQDMDKNPDLSMGSSYDTDTRNRTAVGDQRIDFESGYTEISCDCFHKADGGTVESTLRDEYGKSECSRTLPSARHARLSATGAGTPAKEDKLEHEDASRRADSDGCWLALAQTACGEVLRADAGKANVGCLYPPVDAEAYVGCWCRGVQMMNRIMNLLSNNESYIAATYYYVLNLAPNSTTNGVVLRFIGLSTGEPAGRQGHTAPATVRVYTDPPILRYFEVYMTSNLSRTTALTKFTKFRIIRKNTKSS
ncbi:hypothetical protein EV424DRAFT_1351857 [Suillus variegatus]|nr:hypothetical protein EV424DRAFT_1351857 [Suillus variegatus]